MNQLELKQLLHYDPETGLFTWLKPKRYSLLGKRAGSPDKYDYTIIRINRQGFRACRLAWLYMTGEWPARDIDHINRAKDDDRWENLRLATPSQNQYNSVLRRDNSVGLKGVSMWRGKYQAHIRVNGRLRHLGYFESADLAHAAYIRAARSVAGEFASSGDLP